MPADALAIISFCSDHTVDPDLFRGLGGGRGKRPLAAEIASWLPNRMWAAAVESNTTDPPFGVIATAAARTTANADFRLVATVASHSSSERRCSRLQLRGSWRN